MRGLLSLRGNRSQRVRGQANFCNDRGIVTGDVTVDQKSKARDCRWVVLTLQKTRMDKMSEVESDNWQPKIVAFLCNWCSYGAADLAGVSRLQYPPYIRAIRLPCTGRMNPKFLLAAFRQGADGIWVSG